MAYSFRDYPESPNSRSKGPARPKDEPSWLPKSYRPLPSPDPKNPFGDLPTIQPALPPLNIWNDPPSPAAPYIPPAWPVVPSPSPGTTNPFGDPSKTRLPPIGPPQLPPPYDLGPSNFPGQGGNEPGGGLLGRLAMMQQDQVRSGADSVSTSNGAAENNSGSCGSRQGLLGRLLALQDEQARNAGDAFGGYDPHGTRGDRTYATPPREFQAAPQKTVRLVSRRVVR
jgi:hypothetical protein